MIHGTGFRRMNLAVWDDHTSGHGRLAIGIDHTRGEPGELFIVDTADPKVLIADELLWTMVHHPADLHPDIALEWQPLAPCTPEVCCQCQPNCPILHQRECFYGSKLTISVRDRRLIYIVGEYEAEPNAWWVHWPD